MCVFAELTNTYILPESQLRGLSGSGWAIKAIIALQTDWSVQAGLHAFFSISRQISPVCAVKSIYLQYLKQKRIIEYTPKLRVHYPFSGCPN